jgi:hypothetical protein
MPPADKPGERYVPELRLHGRSRRHGQAALNITYEDVKRAADANSMTVEATLAMIAKTADKDRRDHPAEYATKK